MRKTIIAVLLASTIYTPSLHAQEIAYHLPAGTVGAGYQARLIECSNVREPKVVGAPKIAGTVKQGELVRLKTSSPFLASRNIAMTFHDNGMLKTINADGEAQGGPVIAAILKTAVGFATFGRGPASFTGVATTPTLPVCENDVITRLNALKTVDDRIDSAEQQLAAGKPLGTAAVSLYEANKKKQAALQKALSLSSSVQFATTRTNLESHFGQYSRDHITVKYAEPLKYSKWFSSMGDYTPDKGLDGFCTTFSISKADFDSSKVVQHFRQRKWQESYVEEGKLRTDKRMNRFIYLRPVPVKTQVFEYNATVLKLPDGKIDQKKMDQTCRAKLVADGVLTKKPGLTKLAGKSIGLPQLSDYFPLPLGAGAFESRSTSAEFAKDGRLISIGTKSKGAGTGFAEALAGGLAAADAARGDRKGSLQRQIDIIKLENELDMLNNPSENSTVTDATDEDTAEGE